MSVEIGSRLELTQAKTSIRATSFAEGRLHLSPTFSGYSEAHTQCNRKVKSMRMAMHSALAAATSASQAFTADLTPDTVLGTTLDEIKASLTEMGYEVRKSEMEDGEIEVYVVKDGKMAEVHVSPSTGKPTKIETK